VVDLVIFLETFFLSFRGAATTYLLLLSKLFNSYGALATMTSVFFVLCPVRCLRNVYMRVFMSQCPDVYVWNSQLHVYQRYLPVYQKLQEGNNDCERGCFNVAIPHAALEPLPTDCNKRWQRSEFRLLPEAAALTEYDSGIVTQQSRPSRDDLERIELDVDVGENGNKNAVSPSNTVSVTEDASDASFSVNPLRTAVLINPASTDAEDDGKVCA
jgi:hypothetical protein